MPRLSRNKSKTNFHHVMVQGINKEFIFKDEEHIIAYKNIILNKLKNNPKLLKNFIAQAREETDVKIVELAQIIGISKSSVGNIIKKIL